MNVAKTDLAFLTSPRPICLPTSVHAVDYRPTPIAYRRHVSWNRMIFVAYGMTPRYPVMRLMNS